MDPPSTVIDPTDGTKVLVTWVEPYDNSDPIREYKILFKSKDGLYYEIADECTSALPTLVLSCSVAMSTL